MSGWIKIHRSMRKWRYYRDKNMKCLWLHLLLNAEYEDTVIDGNVIERGSLYTSQSELQREVGLTRQEVRDCLQKLENNQQITKQTTKKGTKITICNFASYQDLQPAEQPREQPTNNQAGKAPLIPPDGFHPDPLSLSPLISPHISSRRKKEDIMSPTDFDFVMVLWNTSAKRSIPKVKALSPARKEKVKLRIKEMGGWEKAKETLAECFKKIGDSDFCNGATGKWVASFDWFFENEKNWMKVLEGNYDNRQEKSQLEVLAENIKRADEYYTNRYGYGSPYGNPAGGGPYGPDEQ